MDGEEGRRGEWEEKKTFRWKSFALIESHRLKIYLLYLYSIPKIVLLIVVLIEKEKNRENKRMLDVSVGNIFASNCWWTRKQNLLSSFIIIIIIIIVIIEHSLGVNYRKGISFIFDQDIEKQTSSLHSYVQCFQIIFLRNILVSVRFSS